MLQFKTRKEGDYKSTTQNVENVVVKAVREYQGKNYQEIQNESGGFITLYLGDTADKAIPKGAYQKLKIEVVTKADGSMWASDAFVPRVGL